MFEVQTYAAATDYVPDWLDNRKRYEEGGEYFYVKILPLNDSEFQTLRAADPKTEAADLNLRIVEKRVPEICKLSIRSNDGSVLSPKRGADLLNGVRDQLDTARYWALIGELVTAALNHSKLSEGELKGSGSSSESPAPEM